MAEWTIMPAPERPEKCPAADYDAIKRGGELRLPALKAKEAIRNSKGGYVIKPAAVAVEVQTGIDLEIGKMTNEQLKTIVMASGKRMTKKITRKALVDLARRCIAEAAEVVDDDEEIDGSD